MPFTLVNWFPSATAGYGFFAFLYKVRDEDPVLAIKTDPELRTYLNAGRFLNILDILKGLLFCLNTSGVRRSIDVLDSENQSRSGSVKFGPDPGL